MPTLRQMRDMLDEATDGQKNRHLPVPEKNKLIQSAVAETWDKMISSGMSNHRVKLASFSSNTNVLEYDTKDPSIVPDGDFYKVHQIYIDENSGQKRPLPRLNPAEIQAFRPPQQAVPVLLYYIPTAPTFLNADGSWNDDANFDDLNGWAMHAIMTAAMHVKAKKEDDYRFYQQRKQELEQRIGKMSMTDFSEAPRVVRRRRRAQDPFMLFRNNINAWLIRDAKISLFYHYGYVP